MPVLQQLDVKRLHTSLPEPISFVLVLLPVGTTSKRLGSRWDSDPLVEVVLLF